jgi:mRNA-degrading endonuclease toxin of MazEF toxin-antitoxin module
MTACNRGDIVLIGFVFSDDSGKKLRPAVVITQRTTTAHDKTWSWRPSRAT